LDDGKQALQRKGLNIFEQGGQTGFVEVISQSRSRLEKVYRAWRLAKKEGYKEA
jgi:hypothetical protein